MARCCTPRAVAKSTETAGDQPHQCRVADASVRISGWGAPTGLCLHKLPPVRDSVLAQRHFRLAAFADSTTTTTSINYDAILLSGIPDKASEAGTSALNYGCAQGAELALPAHMPDGSAP